jgi:hypothetical protein
VARGRPPPATCPRYNITRPDTPESPARPHQDAPTRHGVATARASAFGWRCGIVNRTQALVLGFFLGVLRRWRWTFWLILVAFGFGVLRVPLAILQLTGVLNVSTPSWYVLLQGLIGLAQFAIAFAMLVGYRRSGVWGTF